MATAVDRYQGRIRADERAVPRRLGLKLDANQSVGIGWALVLVAGFLQVPSAANAATGPSVANGVTVSTAATATAANAARADLCR